MLGKFRFWLVTAGHVVVVGILLGIALVLMGGCLVWDAFRSTNRWVQRFVFVFIVLALTTVQFMLGIRWPDEAVRIILSVGLGYFLGRQQ